MPDLANPTNHGTHLITHFTQYVIMTYLKKLKPKEIIVHNKIQTFVLYELTLSIMIFRRLLIN